MFVSSSLWICIKLRLMHVAQKTITFPSTLTTWKGTFRKHLSCGCNTSSSQEQSLESSLLCMCKCLQIDFVLTWEQSGSLKIFLYIPAGLTFAWEQVSILALRNLVLLLWYFNLYSR